MKLLLAGGGTGGHIFPALAVAEEWLRRGKERSVLFVGTNRGLEAKLVPEKGLPLKIVRSAGLKGIGGLRLLKNAAMLIPSIWDVAGILRRERFAVALGTGGYVTGPVLFAATLASLPAVVFESNAEPGFTNRVLAELVTRVACAFPEPAERWGRKAVVTGCPVRAEFFQAPVRRPAAPFRLLITGGSQGALPINRVVVDAMERFASRKSELVIVHQTGERDYDAVRTAYARREIHAEVVPFLTNMPERFAQADLILCRSGAITVAEVAAAGRAAIFIPFGRATDSHQLRNAQALGRLGAARVVPEPELTAARLTTEIFSLLEHPARLAEMGSRARALARPQAAAAIVNLIEEAARL